MSADLATTYLGLALTHPVVASAGPLTGRIDTLKRLVEGGAAAVVLPSLFEEEIVHAAMHRARIHSHMVDVFSEASTFLPDLPPAPDVPTRYLELVGNAKAVTAETQVPVIASLNGTSPSGWLKWASALADEGADALELNVYLVAADPGDTAASIEARVVELVGTVCERVSIPVAVKLSPYFTAVGDVARRVVEAGAKGVVLFNRFYQPDIDLDDLVIRPDLELSTSADMRLPLRWTALLSGRLGADIALSGGVHRGEDVVKALLVGATVAMTTASVLRNGPGHIATLCNGLSAWLDEHDYESVDELRGAMAQGAVADPDAFERANYLEVIRRASRI